MVIYYTHIFLRPIIMGAASSTPAKLQSASTIKRIQIAPFVLNIPPETPLLQNHQIDLERFSRTWHSISAEISRTPQQRYPVQRVINGHLPQANMWLSIFESLKISELAVLMLTCKHLLHASNANTVRGRLHNAKQQAKFHAFFRPAQDELRLPAGYQGIQQLANVQPLAFLPNLQNQVVNPGPQGFVMNL